LSARIDSSTQLVAYAQNAPECCHLNVANRFQRLSSQS
jgi:hypothetical protein